MSAAIDLSNKVERLTFAAQANVVDHRGEMEKIKKTQNEILKKILDEEREAEEQRQEVETSLYNFVDDENIYCCCSDN